MYCHDRCNGLSKKIVQDIVTKKAGYAIVVKENQKHLYKAIAETFQEQQVVDIETEDMMCVTEEYAHGRYERRTYAITDDLSRIPQCHEWKGLTHIGKVTCERYIHDVYQQETRYYILRYVDTAKKLAEASHGHWGIENSVHWSLDVTFHEDAIRIYDGYGAENLATVRRIALNVLKRDTTRRLSIRNKRRLCVIKPEYLIHILGCVVSENV